LLKSSDFGFTFLIYLTLLTRITPHASPYSILVYTLFHIVLAHKEWDENLYLLVALLTISNLTLSLCVNKPVADM
jgi:hypothetical protein